MDTKYSGMRWLKCDLHMQTPADATHWEGDRMEAGQEAESAKEFAMACHEQGLDVIGITDHNFLSENFIPLLQKEFDKIEQEFNHKVTLFPGFEITAAGVGRGAHVLCLFNPREDRKKLSSILSELGIQRSEVPAIQLKEKSDKNLKDILRIVQDDRNNGIVIMPHATSNDGIFDNHKISKWQQQDQFTNPDLLAIEIPKPVSLMTDIFQKILNSGENCQPGWKRARPIATLMSSDNKKLVACDEHQNPAPNSIGYRYSWIKMSEPSIESLRQAFLDHESRIILPKDVTKDINPDKCSKKAIIKSVSIKNVEFLANQEVHFSSDMNCIIGGRGSGKSTILEYMRIVLGKDNSRDIDKGTEERIERVRNTLKKETAEIKMCWISEDGVEDSIVWKNGELIVQDCDMPDLETFFSNLPIHFYSQQQISHLTESKADDGNVRQAQPLLELVDRFAKIELDDLANQENTLKRQIKDSFSNLSKVRQLEKDYRRFKQEYQELNRQWKARREIEVDARQHQLLKAESRYLEKLEETLGKQCTNVITMARTIADSHIPFENEKAPHAVWFSQFDTKVEVAQSLLVSNICNAVDQFKATVNELKTNNPEWGTIQNELDQADAKFKEACESKGLTMDDVGRLQEISRLRSAKQNEIDITNATIQQLKEAAGNTEQLMQQLYEIWRKQFQKREEATEKANKLAVLKGGKRFIEVSVKYQQDYKHFQNLWQKFAPDDGRRRLGKQWESYGKNLYDFFVNREGAKSPWQILEDFLSEGEKSVRLDLELNKEDMLQHIQNNSEQWEELRCSRVKDTIDMKLFRADDSIAGSIAKGSLSDGQRNTAALALLLAQEGGPLIIDQPEDELDSNFVFWDLIPILRKVKLKRQLIMATHNANLPVNGDAELIYALETRSGKGEMLACGGLDQSPVTNAVLNIMEGSEEAFRRRREKYHF